MNEKIKELLKQASKLANTDDNKDLDRNFDMIVAEKFAELIVEECLYIVEGEDDGSVDTKSVRLAMLRMKQHFGVEE